MKIALLGAGLMGSRRARTIAEIGADTVASVYDVNMERAHSVANAAHAVVALDPHEAISLADAVVVATTPEWLIPMSDLAAAEKKPVLIEKPAGKCAQDIEAFAKRHAEHVGRIAVGFTLRHHESVARALSIVRGELLGKVMWIRAAYGHGGREGYAKEWRCDPKVSGGGELRDQGIHLIDLACQITGGPLRLLCAAACDHVWKIDVDSDAMLLCQGHSRQVVQLHASWTQWRPMFRIEIGCEGGLIQAEGLGGSYGPETLRVWDRTTHLETTEGDGTRALINEWERFRSVAAGVIESRDLADAIAANRLVDECYE